VGPNVCTLVAQVVSIGVFTQPKKKNQRWQRWQQWQRWQRRQRPPWHLLLPRHGRCSFGSEWPCWQCQQCGQHARRRRGCIVCRATSCQYGTKWHQPMEKGIENPFQKGQETKRSVGTNQGRQLHGRRGGGRGVADVSIEQISIEQISIELPDDTGWVSPFRVQRTRQCQPRVVRTTNDIVGLVPATGCATVLSKAGQRIDGGLGQCCFCGRGIVVFFGE
jgi:hypothetical protein